MGNEMQRHGVHYKREKGKGKREKGKGKGKD
jgi:hypothetical protein